MGDTYDENDHLRAAFYLLVFPASIFLAQVYSEGLFLGLSFATLACLHRRRWLPTAILAALTFWVRPGGALLLVPMVTVWLMDRSWQKNWKSAVGSGLAALVPLFSYLVFSWTELYAKFHVFEVRFFGSGRTDVPCGTQWASLSLPHEHFWMYDLAGSLQGWASALQSLDTCSPPADLLLRSRNSCRTPGAGCLYDPVPKAARDRPVWPGRDRHQPIERRTAKHAAVYARSSSSLHGPGRLGSPSDL